MGDDTKQTGIASNTGPLFQFTRHARSCNNDSAGSGALGKDFEPSLTDHAIRETIRWSLIGPGKNLGGDVVGWCKDKAPLPWNGLEVCVSGLLRTWCSAVLLYGWNTTNGRMWKTNAMLNADNDGTIDYNPNMILQEFWNKMPKTIEINVFSVDPAQPRDPYIIEFDQQENSEAGNRRGKYILNEKDCTRLYGNTRERDPILEGPESSDSDALIKARHNAGYKTSGNLQEFMNWYSTNGRREAEAGAGGTAEAVIGKGIGSGHDIDPDTLKLHIMPYLKEVHGTFKTGNYSSELRNTIPRFIHFLNYIDTLVGEQLSKDDVDWDPEEEKDAEDNPSSRAAKALKARKEQTSTSYWYTAPPLNPPLKIIQVVTHSNVMVAYANTMSGVYQSCAVKRSCSDPNIAVPGRSQEFSSKYRFNATVADAVSTTATCNTDEVPSESTITNYKNIIKDVIKNTNCCILQAYRWPQNADINNHPEQIFLLMPGYRPHPRYMGGVLCGASQPRDSNGGSVCVRDSSGATAVKDAFQEEGLGGLVSGVGGKTTKRKKYKRTKRKHKQTKRKHKHKRTKKKHKRINRKHKQSKKKISK